MSIESSAERLWGGGQLIAGPMVRASSLPFRLACLHYGADVVYSEELLAARAMNCKRIENHCINSVDFIRSHHETQDVVFRTSVDSEKSVSRCVLQLGASDAASALRAARVFEADVAAIDVNMGCPKHYAVSVGMGSQLMASPEIAEDIIKTLRRNISVPISVKTRIFCAGGAGRIDLAATLEWVRRLQAAGTHAVALHARSAAEKSDVSPHDDVYSLVHSALANTNTYMVCNGDVWSYEDTVRINDIILAGGGTSALAGPRPCFMLARPALWDPAVFRALAERLPAGQRAASAADTLSTIVRKSAESANCLENTKFLMQNILAGSRKLCSDLRSDITKARSILQLSQTVGCEAAVSAELERQSAYHRRPGHAVGCEEYSGLRGCVEWPGLVSKTCHTYRDSYFDDNYYTAFRRAPREESSGRAADRKTQGGEHKKFAYSALSEVSTTVFKKPKRQKTNDNRSA